MSEIAEPTEAALRKFRKDFEKSYPSTSLRSASEIPAYEVVPTGSLLLDRALGTGGYVKGRLVEFWGATGSAKTTLALLGIAEAQQADPRRCALIDVEATFDPAWAILHGVDPDRLDIAQPDTGENSADALYDLLASGQYSMVVLDSIGALISDKEFDPETAASDQVVGRVAKIVTRMVNSATKLAPRHGTVVLFLNQQRANIGSFTGPTVTKPGGYALQHSTTQALDFRRTKEAPYFHGTDDEKHQIGVQIAVTVSKNKLAPPKATATIDFFNQAIDGHSLGIDRASEALTLGKRLGAIQCAGSYYTLPDESQHQGKKTALAHLREHPEVVETIRSRILDAVTEQAEEASA
jgi:recombination protein RecA